MKKKLNKNHKGLAMAMAVGFAAMAAPMTAQAEELPDTPAQPGETETPVPASTKEGETPVESAPVQETQTPLTNENETPIGSTPVQGVVTPPTGGEVTPPTGSDEGNPSTGSEENPPVEDNKTPIENPETLDDALHNVDLAEQDVKDKENALEEKTQEENKLLEEQTKEEEKKESADGTMTELEGELADEVNNSQEAVNDAKNDLKELEADPENVTGKLEEAEADLKGFLTESDGNSENDGTGDNSTPATPDAVANAQTDLENARKEAEDAQKAYENADGEHGTVNKAELAMNEAKTALDEAKTTLTEKQDAVTNAQTALDTAQSALNGSLESASAGSSGDQKTALENVKTEWEALKTDQKTLNGALATQAAIEDARKSLTEIEEDLNNLNDDQIKDYEDSLNALSEAEEALTNAENALTNSNSAFDSALTALSSLSTAQTNLKKACDALNNVTQEDLEADPYNLDELKAKLKTAYDQKTIDQNIYDDAVEAIGTLKTISGLNVPTADLLDENLKYDKKEALLTTLKSAVATNLEIQKANAEAVFAKAQWKIANSANGLITVANEMLKELDKPNEPATPTRDGDSVEAPLSEVKASVKSMLTELITIAQTTGGVKQESEADTEVSPTDITGEKARDALNSLKAIKDDNGSLKVKTDVTKAKDPLDKEWNENEQNISDMQNTVTASRAKLAEAVKSLSGIKTVLEAPDDGSPDEAENPSETITIKTVQGQYDAMVEAESTLDAAKDELSDAQSKLDEAESNYIEKARAFEEAKNERTWLQKELDNTTVKVGTANQERNKLLKDAPTESADNSFVRSYNAWVTACDKLGTLQQNIIEAKNELAQKKQDLTVAIAKKEITDKIKNGTLKGDAVNTETENTVNRLINTLGIETEKQDGFKSRFSTHVVNYHDAFMDYDDAVTQLEALKGKIATATAAKEEAAKDLEKAQTNLAIAEAVRDSFLTKPVTPSQGGTSGQTVRKPIPLSIEDLIALRAAVYDSQAGDLPSYTDADKTETTKSNDTQWTSAEYTYAGFLDECEKGILSISPMKKRTSPNLELSVENTTFNIVTKTWMSFDKKVINALSTRPDLSIDLKFLYKGKWYRALIPAGYNLKSLLNKDGYCGFLYLYKLFGVNGQTAASC